MSKRDNSVMVRLTDAELNELDGMAEKVEIPASTLAHNAVTALMRSFREHRSITSPLRLAFVPEYLSNPRPIPPMGELGFDQPGARPALDLTKIETGALEAELKRRRKK